VGREEHSACCSSTSEKVGRSCGDGGGVRAAARASTEPAGDGGGMGWLARPPRTLACATPFVLAALRGARRPARSAATRQPRAVKSFSSPPVCFVC
jgi:hypothetical protein